MKKVKFQWTDLTSQMVIFHEKVLVWLRGKKKEVTIVISPLFPNSRRIRIKD